MAWFLGFGKWRCKLMVIIKMYRRKSSPLPSRVQRLTGTQRFIELSHMANLGAPRWRWDIVHMSLLIINH